MAWGTHREQSAPGAYATGADKSVKRKHRPKAGMRLPVSATVEGDR